jgi:hypothetical protein
MQKAQKQVNSRTHIHGMIQGAQGALPPFPTLSGTTYARLGAQSARGQCEGKYDEACVRHTWVDLEAKVDQLRLATLHRDPGPHFHT